MSEASPPGGESLPPSLTERVAAASGRFEGDWKSGRRSRIEDHLAGIPEPDRSALLHRLLALELAYRARDGEQPTQQEYRGRFPEHLMLVARAFTEVTASASPPTGANQPTISARTSADDATTDMGGSAPQSVPERGEGYQLRSEIARGGMGMVLRGYDAELDRELAIKVLLQRHQDCPDLVRRFHQEAKIHGQLQHPGVAPVHRLGLLPDGRPFFAMKLVEGRTLAALLADRLDRDRELPDFVKIFEQICQTMAYAHDKGILHRDLKPSNIMVGAFGEVQIMDWGLARRLRSGVTDPVGPRPTTPADLSISEPVAPEQADDDAAPGGDAERLTQAGTAVGTPAYMAPEQARGELDRLDERCDVFGLGAILCEILTGKAPYPTGDTFEALRRAQAGDLTDAFSRLDGCGTDATLIALAKRCLAADPSERPLHAGEVAAAVTAYQHSVAERLRRTELERAAAEARVAEEGKRRRVRLALVAAVLGVIVVGGGGALWSWQERRMALVRDVEVALAEVASHQQAGRWSEVWTALEQAERRLGRGGPAPLRARVSRARRDRELVMEFSKIHDEQSRPAGGREFDYARTDARYAAAFRGYDIDMAQLGVAEAAARVRDSAIRDELLTALDHWLRLRVMHGPPSVESDKLRAVADGADDSSWRRGVRAALVSRDTETLRALAGQDEALRQPPAVLFLLGEALRLVRQPEEAAILWRRALHLHPDDFWMNFELGKMLSLDQGRTRLEEGIGYLRAAAAISTGDGAVHNNLGKALQAAGDLEGAIIELQPPRSGALFAPRVLEMEDPDALNNLAWILATCDDARLRDPPQAIGIARRAVSIRPTNRAYCRTLGVAYYRQGEWKQAVETLERSMAMNRSGDSSDWFFLAMACWQMGRREDARRWYRQAVAWMEKHAREDAELLRFRAEAAHLLGLPEREMLPKGSASGGRAPLPALGEREPSGS
jgi:serine/threonine-protein kinase